MRLVFLTQVLDEQDAILGFVPRWIEGLAHTCERVRVLALTIGTTTHLPANVDTREIGRRGILRRYLRYRRHLADALTRDGFDTVLAHMVPRYALVAAGPTRRAGARLYLWYTHKAVDRRLRLACERVDKVFTASPESLRIDTPRKIVTGHGIDLAHFAPRRAPETPPRLLAVGRITPAKDPLTLIEATALLIERGHDLHLDLVGAGLARGDEDYGRAVAAEIQARGLAARVSLHGEVPYPEVPRLYERATLLVHASRTGSVDKVVLEAMAAERPVVSSNEASRPLFAELGSEAEQLCFAPGDARTLADRVEALLGLPPGARAELGRKLRAICARDHEVDALMRRLAAEMAA